MLVHVDTHIFFTYTLLSLKFFSSKIPANFIAADNAVFYQGETMSSIEKKPLVTDLYTADPSAHAFNGKIYIYPSHDRDIEDRKSVV